MIKAACVTFPGSNCDQDIHRAASLMDWELVKLWHQNALTDPVDVVFIPGGFSYGDYLRCGALARFSPAMNSILDHARGGGLVVGICNGFQILCEAGLLPGALHRNARLQFRCIPVQLRVANPETPFTNQCIPDETLTIPIAHGEGNYYASHDVLNELRDHGRIVFEYMDNPNGSLAGIAGICNEAGNILGMMPHPERAMEELLGGEDGRKIFESIAASLAKAGA